jgi:hypothetical protein
MLRPQNSSLSLALQRAAHFPERHVGRESQSRSGAYRLRVAGREHANLSGLAGGQEGQSVWRVSSVMPGLASSTPSMVKIRTACACPL